MRDKTPKSIQNKLEGVKYDIINQLRQEVNRSGISVENEPKISFDWDSHVELYCQHFYQAFASSKPGVFSEFLEWARSVQESRDMPDSTLQKIHILFKQELKNKLDPAESEQLLSFFEAGIEQSRHLKSSPESYLDPDKPHGKLAIEYLHHLLQGNRKRASKLIFESVEEGTEIRDIYMHVFQPCQYEIGQLWQLNRLSVAQEHFCTAATQMIMSQLYPRIFSAQRNGKRVVATAIGGELHEIGVRMVTDFFEMEGWDTFYLGANCPAQDIIKELIEREADLLALSVTMTQYLETARELIYQVKSDDQVSGIKVLVGGRPFGVDDELWKQVGADGFAWDAQQAIKTATKLVEEEAV